MKPLLSIVIANYNYGRFLEAAIRSVLEQLTTENTEDTEKVRAEDVELIIIDGGSTDNSVEVIKKYAGGIPPGVERLRSKLENGKQYLNGEIFECLNRRDAAGKKVEEWLAGVDDASFETALAKLVDEKAAAGEYVFEDHKDIYKSIEAAKIFFHGFSRRIIELSDGRCVYFAPDPRSKLRNSDNAISWAEYAFHSVSSGGDRIPGKNYTYRYYSPYKILNTDLIEPTLRMERCVPVLKSKSALDAVKFFGTAHLGGLFDVVVRLDEYGNVNANMTEVTFEASTKRGQKKMPQLVSLTEAIRTVVSHQTTTGTFPPNEDSIAFRAAESKGVPSNFKLQTPLISYWISEPDKGQSDAFNKGFARARGKYLTWLNADDMLVPGCMKKILYELESHPDCEWFTGNMFRFTEDGAVTEIGWGPHVLPGFLQRKDSPASIAVFGPTTFFSQKILKQVGGIDEALVNTMDYDLWIKFVMAGIHFRRINCFCWAFRMHEASKSAEFDGHKVARETRDMISREGEIIRGRAGYHPRTIWQRITLCWRMLDGSILRSIWYRMTLKRICQVFPNKEG